MYSAVEDPNVIMFLSAIVRRNQKNYGSHRFALMIRSQHAQKVEQVEFVLRAQDKPEPVFVEMHDIQQGLGGAVMEKRGAGGEAAEDRPLDLADMGELPVDQRLAEIAGRLAVAARLTVH